MKRERLPNREILPPDQEIVIEPDQKAITSQVRLKAPRQKDGKSVAFTVGELTALQMLADPGAFRPGRPVINVTFDKETPIDPPIDLRIQITPADVVRAGGRNFRLAYHNGSRWVPWEEEFPCQAGLVKVSLAKVGDPAIGIAP